MDPFAVLERVVATIMWFQENYKNMERAKHQSRELGLRCEHLALIAARVKEHMARLSESDKRLLSIPLQFLETHLDDAKNLMQEIPTFNKMKWAVVGTSKKKKLDDYLQDLLNDETSLTSAQSTLTNELLIPKAAVEVKVNPVVVVAEPIKDDEDLGEMPPQGEALVRGGAIWLVLVGVLMTNVCVCVVCSLDEFGVFGIEERPREEPVGHAEAAE